MTNPFLPSLSTPLLVFFLCKQRSWLGSYKLKHLQEARHVIAARTDQMQDRKEEVVAAASTVKGPHLKTLNEWQPWNGQKTNVHGEASALGCLFLTLAYT